MSHSRSCAYGRILVVCLLLGIFQVGFPSTILAQPDAPHDHADGASHHDHEGATPVLCGICPLSREADGTSWQPDDAPVHEHGWTIGDWQVAAHLQIAAIETRESGPRGDDDFFSTNYAMLSAHRRAGSGVFGITSMWSLEPAMGAHGYPLLLQVGETADGINPLTDRQHPHDLPMELAVTYSRRLAADRAFYVYAAAVGAPALGPPAFMHRASASALPIAPITHHWFDSTHITYGVVTAGIVGSPRFKVEGSAFRGREPDQHRWGFEAPKLDSYAVRLSINPTPSLALQVSAGHLESPEQLHPEADATRLTASAMYSHHWEGIRVDALAAFGRNQRHEVKRPVPGGFFYIPGNLIHATLLESTVRVATRHAVVTRFEHADKDELFGIEDARHFTAYPVARLTTGYVFDAWRARHATVGLGVARSWDWVSDELRPVYGDSPRGTLAFVQLAMH
jgi:hypothetical protein